MGGMTSESTEAWLTSEMEEYLIRRQKEIDNGTRPIVGFNRFCANHEIVKNRPEIHRVSQESSRKQIESVRALKKTRNNNEVKRTLTNLHKKAKIETNLFPCIIEATKAYATVGEIVGTIRQAYGYPYDPFEVVSPVI
jgi:methylmalonyl-CoA mutase N-terminal domain/subunit